MRTDAPAGRESGRAKSQRRAGSQEPGSIQSTLTGVVTADGRIRSQMVSVEPLTHGSVALRNAAGEHVKAPQPTTIHATSIDKPGSPPFPACFMFLSFGESDEDQG